MATTTTYVDTPPEAVFAVLSDACSYEHWVVGAKDIRAWDPGFPAPGTRFHHTFLVGPVPIRDTTSVVELEPPRRIVLKARARPSGSARVTLELRPQGDGTHVTITEVPIEGFAARLHNPIQDELIRLRNVESLRRLRRLAERRAAGES